MDGTLLDLGYDKHFWEEHLPRRFAESRGIAIEEAHLLMQPIFESTAGTLDWYCINYWSRALSLDIVAQKRATRHQIDWLPDSRLISRAPARLGAPHCARNQCPSGNPRNQGRPAGHSPPIRRRVFLARFRRAEGKRRILASPRRSRELRSGPHAVRGRQHGCLACRARPRNPLAVRGQSTRAWGAGARELPSLRASNQCSNWLKGSPSARAAGAACCPSPTPAAESGWAAARPLPRRRKSVARGAPTSGTAARPGRRCRPGSAVR